MIVVAVLFMWCVLGLVVLTAYNLAKFLYRRRS